MGDLSKMQEDVLEKFRSALGAQKREVHDDYDLLRFLRARQFNLDKAMAMYRDNLAWRASFGTDAILQTWSADPEKLKEFKSFYPHGHHGIDKQGRPIYIERIGHIDMAKAMGIFSLEELLRFHVYEWERLLAYKFPTCSQHTGKRVDQCVTILDLEDMSMNKHFTSLTRDALKQLAKIDQDNYPEHLGVMFVINAPSVFTMAWNFVKPLLDKRTVSKINIFSKRSKWEPALLEICDPSMLPDFLGGSNKYSGEDWTENRLGPWWNDEAWNAAYERLSA